MTTGDYIEQLGVTAYLPVQGWPNKEDKQLQSQREFRENRKQHAAVESAINSLEHHGLNRCPDKVKRPSVVMPLLHAVGLIFTA